jgi:hypothetical protein
MFHETEWQATLEGEGRFQTISNQEKANKMQCFERAINTNWRRGSESGRHSELWLAEPSYPKPQLERKLQKIRC